MAPEEAQVSRLQATGEGGDLGCSQPGHAFQQAVRCRQDGMAPLLPYWLLCTVTAVDCWAAGKQSMSVDAAHAEGGCADHVCCRSS